MTGALAWQVKTHNKSAFSGFLGGDGPGLFLLFHFGLLGRPPPLGVSFSFSISSPS